MNITLPAHTVRRILAGIAVGAMLALTLRGNLY